MNWPKYPPYDTGPHLEEQAIARFAGRTIGGRRFLDVPWTPLLNNGRSIWFASKPMEPFFTVSTHDDAPTLETRYPLIRHFAAGGNGGGEPIPLVCESEPPGDYVPLANRTHLVAFSGAETHPIRAKLVKACYLAGLDGPISIHAWSPTISEGRIANTFREMRHSIFALCPRGYGPTSYRLYEAIRCGVIPVYVTDRPWLPFPDVIDWQRLAIITPSPQEATRRIAEMPKSEWSDRIDYSREVAELIRPRAVLDRIERTLAESTI